MTARGRSLAAIAALLASTTVVDAADWTRIATVGVDVHSYDRSKVAIRGDEVSYWRKVVFAAPVRVRAGLARSAIYHERIHCRDHTLKALAWQLFADEGGMLESTTVPEADVAAIAIAPETVGDRFQDLMCGLVEARRRRDADLARDEAHLAARRKELEQLKLEIERLETSIDRMKFEAAQGASAPSTVSPSTVTTSPPPAAAPTTAPAPNAVNAPPAAPPVPAESR